MLENPNVSVIISNRNYGQWLPSAVNSVINQEYNGQIDIVIVDDGSTDNSVFDVQTQCDINCGRKSVCVVELDTNPDLEKRIGRGPAVGRNAGIKYALEHLNPDVFMILDADDEYLPNKVARSVEEWKTDPENIGVVYADYYIVDNEGYKKKEFKPEFSYDRLLGECVVHSNSLISKKAIEECGMYDENFKYATCEDYDLWLTIAKQFVITHIPEFLMNVRHTGQNASNITEKNKKIWEESMAYLRGKHGQRPHI